MLNDEYTRENEHLPTIVKEVTVNAPREEVWNAWTTTEGVESFFAPEAEVALVQGGRYELYFDPSAPEGERGTEGCEVIGYEAPERLSISWNAPPHPHDQRARHTAVDIHLDDLGDGQTQVTLTHYDWHDKEGEEWSRAYERFGDTWDAVLKNLQRRFDHGPVDWNDTAPPRS